MLKFDIILPTLGRESLFNAINSVCRQTYADWHLYIIEDGICVPDLLAQAFNGDDRITWCGLFAKQGRYGAGPRRFGIAKGNAKWMAYIDDDDIWSRNHLETLVELARQNPDATMLRTAGQQFKLGHRSPRSSKKVIKPGPINSTDILTVGMAHTRELYGLTPGWQPVDNHDHLLWADMLAAGGIPAQTDTVTFMFQR